MVLKFLYYLGFAKVKKEILKDSLPMCLQQFSYFPVEVLRGQPCLFWLYQFHYIVKCFFSQSYVLLRCWIMFCPDAGFIGVMILLPIFEANTNFHIDLFVIIYSKVYTYLHLCTRYVGFCNSYQY